MTDTMATTGMKGIKAGIFLLHIHWFFGAFAIIGFILLTFWALRNLSKERLKTFAIWLLAIGIIGSLLTAPAAGLKWKKMAHKRSGAYQGNHMMKQEMMNKMMQHMEENE